MVEKMKPGMAGHSRRGRPWIAALLIAAGVLFLSANLIGFQTSQRDVGVLGRELGETMGDLGETVGQLGADIGEVAGDIGETAGEVGQEVGETVGDLGRSIGDVFAPAPARPDFAVLWPLVLIVAGLLLVLRRPSGGKVKNDDWVNE